MISVLFIPSLKQKKDLFFEGRLKFYTAAIYPTPKWFVIFMCVCPGGIYIGKPAAAIGNSIITAAIYPPKT